MRLTDNQIEDMNMATQELEENANSFFHTPEVFTFGNLTVSHLTTGFEYPVSGDHIVRERARR